MKAGESDAWCREEIRIQGVPEWALLRDFLETCCGHKDDHFLRLDLCAD